MATRGVRLMCPEVKSKFLAALEQGDTIAAATRRAGYRSWSPFYRERKRDQEFAAAWEEAAAVKQLLLRDTAEDELARRGLDGWHEETWTPDPETGELRVTKRVRQRDTRALIALLAANWPEKYGRNATTAEERARARIVVEVEKFAVELQPLAARLMAANNDEERTK